MSFKLLECISRRCYSLLAYIFHCLHFYCIFIVVKISNCWKSWVGIGKACAQRHQKKTFPLMQEDRSENSFLLCNKSPTTAATPGVRMWPPAKLQNSLDGVQMLQPPRHISNTGCFLSYDSSLPLIQLTATHVGSGDSGGATLKGIKTSVHFSKAFRFSYLML